MARPDVDGRRTRFSPSVIPAKAEIRATREVSHESPWNPAFTLVDILIPSIAAASFFPRPLQADQRVIGLQGAGEESGDGEQRVMYRR